MSKVMSMIPGMNVDMLPQGADQNSTRRIKRFMVMMDSMTADELDGVKTADFEKEPSRIWRIVKGAGVPPMAVLELLNEHRRFEKMVGRMGKAGLMKESGDMANLNRNPKQVLSKLQSCVDPTMLQQMGGAQNMLNLMKKMEEVEDESSGAGKKK